MVVQVFVEGTKAAVEAAIAPPKPAPEETDSDDSESEGVELNGAAGERRGRAAGGGRWEARLRGGVHHVLPACLSSCLILLTACIVPCRVSHPSLHPPTLQPPAPPCRRSQRRLCQRHIPRTTSGGWRGEEEEEGVWEGQAGCGAGGAVLPGRRLPPRHAMWDAARRMGRAGSATGCSAVPEFACSMAACHDTSLPALPSPHPQPTKKKEKKEKEKAKPGFEHVVLGISVAEEFPDDRLK